MRTPLFFFLFILLISIAVSAQLPPAIQRIIEANQQDANFALENISFLIAFLAGILSIFSPCTLALLPAFFSYSFKERTEITKMTLVFFLGFALSFVSIGLLIAYLGKTSFAFFQQDSSLLIQIAGIVLIMFGILSIFGKGFSGLIVKMNAKKDIPGIFLFGALYAIGWTACIGPIIASILLMGTVLHNYFYTAILLFFYTLGVAVPLFVMAFLYDRCNFAENKFIQGKLLGFKMLGYKWEVHTTHLISGIMFILLGLIFIIYKGTSIINILDLFGMLATLIILLVFTYLINKHLLNKISSDLFRKIVLILLIISALFLFNYLRLNYGLRTLGWAEMLDRIVLENVRIYNIIGVAALIVLIFLIWKGIKIHKENKKRRRK